LPLETAVEWQFGSEQLWILRMRLWILWASVALSGEDSTASGLGEGAEAEAATDAIDAKEANEDRQVLSARGEIKLPPFSPAPIAPSLPLLPPLLELLLLLLLFLTLSLSLFLLLQLVPALGLRIKAKVVFCMIK
jgi:hypothetical protein